ncbi:PDR/VanB family oxidoreductase [Amycolatopsis thermoflava]|uniref:PDR/VanB family oxidoreductase n=1 Tax=Amycolatopsis thermoflava TaxID=84480 RepID=UPI003656BAFA
MTTAGMRLAAAASGAYRRVFAAGPVAPLLSRPNPVRRTGYDLDVVVRRVRQEAEDVVSLTLAGDDLPAWQPGAHLDVFLPSGLQRAYSLCGDPAESTYRIAVRRLGAGSREMHALREGDGLRVRGPRNAFSLMGNAPSYLFVAAGIGITPILPMARARPGRLVYLGRSRATMPFLSELDGAEVRPDDECGPPDLREILSLAEPGAAVYLCGPPPLMAPAQRILRELNPTASLHTERFSPPVVEGGRPFEVHLRRSGRTVEVGAEESALSAIGRVLDVPYSCRQGFCGTCKVRVLDGEVEHRDRLLTPSERGDAMLVCVSRATGRLVLDL